MKKIEIYIYDSAIKKKILEKQDENALYGFEKNKISEMEKMGNQQLTPFWFDENMLSGFWIDPDIDDDTKTQDIVFYIGSVSFKTPLTSERKLFLTDILNDRK